MGERLPAAAEDSGDRPPPVSPERGRTPLLHFPYAYTLCTDKQKSEKDYSRFSIKRE